MKQRSNCLHFCAGAELRAGVDLTPGGAFFGKCADFGAIAQFGGLFPVLNDLKIGDFFEAGEDGGVFGFVDLLAAGVVAAAFHVADAQGSTDDLFKKRDIAEEELLLEGFGAGGNDDALFGEQGGDQVGEGLAGAGSGFDDQLAFFGESFFDGDGHLDLAGA